MPPSASGSRRDPSPSGVERDDPRGATRGACAPLADPSARVAALNPATIALLRALADLTSHAQAHPTDAAGIARLRQAKGKAEVAWTQAGSPHLPSRAPPPPPPPPPPPHGPPPPEKTYQTPPPGPRPNPPGFPRPPVS